MKPPRPTPLVPLTLAAAAILFSSTSATAQVSVTTEVDFGTARETNGTFVFSTVPSNSSTDLAHGLTFAVLAGSPHKASGPIKVLTDGPAQKNWDHVSASFFATDDTTNIRIQVKLKTIHDIGQINTYSWHRNSRSRQQYRVYAALAPGNSAPNFTAASFQNDAALANLGYKAVASADTGSHSGGQAGVSVAGKIGLNQYILFDIKPHSLSSVQRATFFGEIDIVRACPAGSNNYGTGLTGKNGVPTLTASAPPVIGKSINLLASNSSGAPTSGLLVVGLKSVSIPFLGGRLLADPVVLNNVPVPIGGLVLPVTIPNVCGASVYVQVLQRDQAALAGVSMTPGLRLVLGK